MIEQSNQSTPEAPFGPSTSAPQGQQPVPPRAPRAIPLPGVTPVFSYAFLVANVIVFLVGLALDLMGVQPSLITLGWKDTLRIAAGEYWRLVTPIFLHGGLIHLFFNSYALYIIGPQVERIFGYLRFVAIYLLSGIAGVIASMAFKPDVPSVGASGAIFGLLGALMVYLYRNRELLGGMGRRRLAAVIQVAVINLIIGFAPNIDNWGHIGGLAGGAALAWLTGPLFVLRSEYDGSVHVDDRSPAAARWLGIVVGGAALAALTTLVVLANS